MKKINVARVVWIVCLFLLLIVILLMVMDYKINYQYLNHNYIYFYECSGNLCVSTIEDNQKLLFSAYDCGYDDCPSYKKDISDDYVLLEGNDGNILYQYRKNMVVSKDYDDYEFIDNHYIIVKIHGLYGVIDLDNTVVIKPVYDEIGIHSNGYLTGYNINSIIVKKNDKYGLLSYKDGKMIEEFLYTDENLEELVAFLK